MVAPGCRCGAAGGVGTILITVYSDRVIAGAFYIDGSVTSLYGNGVAICVFDCSGIV